MATLFVTLRLTGQVSNEVARDLLAQLSTLTADCDASGVDVRQSVDARLDPEPEPDVEPVAEPVATTDDVPEPEHEDPV